MRQLKITIRGEVQGVFFRSFVQETATRLRLKGYVKNTDKGYVEIAVQGKDESLKQFIEKCKQGPEAARVEKFEVKEDRVTAFDSFEIKY
mgnify:CR=1 FL=1